jgi:dihydroorotate dehydrogenase
MALRPLLNERGMSVASDVILTPPAVPPPVPIPLYRFDRTFEENVTAGPNFSGPFLAVPATPLRDFFGYRVASRFGIAASLLLNERWFELYSRLGFDLLTYKTIRSRGRQAHPPPNWLYLDETSALTGDAETLKAISGTPLEPLTATAAGSIGMPSSSPEVWRRDIRNCRARLRPGQVMIVSVVGTADGDTGERDFIDDYSGLATEARDAGAHAVELNFSCPNVGGREGDVYRDAETAADIAGAARNAVGSLPLLAKIGPLESADRMASLLQHLSGLIDGVVMINAPRRMIADSNAAPAFGANRAFAGMMGGATFDIAMRCVRSAVQIVERDKLDLKVLAVGGACTPERIDALFNAGAYAVLAASACAWDPYLAIRAKRHNPLL